MSKITIGNYFNQLEQEKKEKIISLSNVYDDTFDGETTNLDSDSEIIKYIINRPILRQKEKIRDAIKELIEKKIKLIESKKVIKKKE